MALFEGPPIELDPKAAKEAFFGFMTAMLIVVVLLADELFWKTMVGIFTGGGGEGDKE